MFTSIFIYITFAVIIIADIIFVVEEKKGSTKWKTITSVFRRWYKSALVPFMVGAVFIGHFGLFIPVDWLPVALRVTIFIILSLAFIIWCIIEKIIEESPLVNNSKLYNLFCRFWILPMALGSVVGCFWKG